MLYLSQLGLDSVLHQHGREVLDLARSIFTRLYEHGTGNLPTIAHHNQVVATALLVGVGANLGLPMSTTHVSTGAIAGVAGINTERINRRTARDLALAWTVTPLVAALISGISYLIAV